MQKNSVFSDLYYLPNKLALMGHTYLVDLWPIQREPHLKTGGMRL
jgi:hypothetical protein